MFQTTNQQRLRSFQPFQSVDMVWHKLRCSQKKAFSVIIAGFCWVITVTPYHHQNGGLAATSIMEFSFDPVWWHVGISLSYGFLKHKNHGHKSLENHPEKKTKKQPMGFNHNIHVDHFLYFDCWSLISCWSSTIVQPDPLGLRTQHKPWMLVFLAFHTTCDANTGQRLVGLRLGHGGIERT